MSVTRIIKYLRFFVKRFFWICEISKVVREEEPGRQAACQVKQPPPPGGGPPARQMRMILIYYSRTEARTALVPPDPAMNKIHDDPQQHENVSEK